MTEADEWVAGYKKGFGDGYKQAMEEVFRLAENQKKEAFSEMTTAGVQPRIRWPPW